MQSYITSLHPGLSRAKSNGTRRCSAVRRLSSPRSPDVVLGERVLRMLISCPECHRIPLTRSVFMFGTIGDTPNIIRTGCSMLKMHVFENWLLIQNTDMHVQIYLKRKLFLFNPKFIIYPSILSNIGSFSIHVKLSNIKFHFEQFKWNLNLTISSQGLSSVAKWQKV